jgi:CBS-domain-containing membrane protein
MKREVTAVSPDTTAHEAARIIVSHRVGTLPVVDDMDVLVGVVRLEDILRVFMPDFVALMDNIDFVHDFGALETLRPEQITVAEHLVMRDLMQPPVSVEQTAGLLRAFATMTKHELRDLPVVNAAGTLVGIASRVDIAAAFLAPWAEAEEPT